MPSSLEVVGSKWVGVEQRGELGAGIPSSQWGGGAGGGGMLVLLGGTSSGSH